MSERSFRMGALRTTLGIFTVGAACAVHAADQQLPILRLGNQPDCCEEPGAYGSSTGCPPYLVPPLYLPADLCPPVQEPATSPPAPAGPETNPAGEMVTIKSARPQAPSGSESTFAEPADLGEVFSEERAERLNRLNSLLEMLHERLRRSAPPLEAGETVEQPPVVDQTAPAPKDDSHSPAASASAPEIVLPDGATAEGEDPPGEGTAAASTPAVPAQEAAESSSAPAMIEPTEPVSVDAPDLTPPPEPSNDSERQRTPIWIAQTAVEAPVDRLALADNLFAAGETETALSIYGEIDLQALDPVDQHWVEMQLANCYRRLNDIEEASRYYRRLVTVEQPAWISEMARWWLATLDKRKSMIRQSNELDAMIRELREQVHAESRR